MGMGVQLKRNLEAALNCLAALTIVAHVVSVLVLEAHMALPARFHFYYPTQALLNPLNGYISATGDCLTDSPPVWARVSAAVATLCVVPLLRMLPSVARGGRPALRCPLMLIAACCALVDLQIWMHYFATEKLCEYQGKKTIHSQPPNIRPALIFRGARGLCWLSIAVRLLLLKEPYGTAVGGGGKRRGSGGGGGGGGGASFAASSSSAAPNTRSRTTAAVAAARKKLSGGK